MARITPAKIEEQFSKFVTAWETLAPTKKFGSHSLEEFKGVVGTSTESRSGVRTAEAALSGAIDRRENADDITLAAMDAIKKSVIADPEVGGDDGALYEAMGYIPKSKRKTGNTRKKEPKTAPVAE